MFGVPAFRPRTSNGYDPRVDVASREEAHAMNVNVAGFTTGVLDANLADAAQRETELRNRHQEQFNKLRARLRSLETESAIMSQPVLELRRKQQELLASKRYAEAFEHMKIIKAAEKEVMQAHREEHRRVNEESVRKLLEDQARERESLRKSLRGASARVQTHPRSPGAADRAGDPAGWPTPGRGGFDAGAPAVFAAGVAGTEPRSIRRVDARREPSPGVYYYDVPSTAGPGGARDARGGDRGEGARRGFPIGEEEEASRKRVFDARAHERALAAPVSARAGPPSAGSASMRSIPDTWQATAVNARPRGAAVGAPARAEPLETAASALLAAALALVGGEVSARAGPSSTARAAGGSPRASARARPDGDALSGAAPGEAHGVPAAGAATTGGIDPDATPAAEGIPGGIRLPSANARDALVSGVSKIRAGAAARDAFRSTRRRGDDSEDEDDDLDDAPLAVLGAQAPNAGGHVVPSIDFSRLDLRGGERFSRDARDEAPAAAPPERGTRKFLNASAKVTSLVRVRSSDDAARGEARLVGDAGEDAADEARRGDADGGPGLAVVASAPPQQTETRERDALISRVKKKTAAAKLLMRKASLSSATKAPRDDAVSEDSSQLGRGESRRSEDAETEASTDAASSERSNADASSFDANSPQKPRRVAPAAPGAPRTEAERAAEAERETRVAEVQKRRFTTEDFRNLFSYSRHGKYKQVTDLLKSGCPAEGRDKFGNSPLVIACQNGNARIVKALLRHGANIDAQNKQGCTGLHYCIAYGFNSLSDYLIAKGANDKLLNKIGLTPYEGIK